MLKTRILATLLLVAAIGVSFFSYSHSKSFPFKLGLDLAGGTHLVYKADVSEIPSGDVSASMDALKNVVERRVNLFGVSEPIVQVEKGSLVSSAGSENKLIVELPGITNVEEAVKSIGKTPTLDFRLLKTDVAKAIESASSTQDEKSLALAKALEPTGVTGRMIQHAQIDFNQQTGAPGVLVTFNTDGKALFAKVTKENVGNTLAIFLDNKEISAPTIREEISDGRALISGTFTLDEAKALVRDLNYGALPVPIELVSTQTVGASLGQRAVDGGVAAGIWSLIVIAIFLIVWYRLPGLVATVALMVYAAIMLALFRLIPVTLTAAGIAGFILSIGMAVDANILIFERMKEELARGRGMWDAMHEGFARAWLSIRDSNISSIITGVILYYFGHTSVVTGFALVFVIGVLVSMFTAITASRLFLYSIAPKKSTGASSFLFSNGFRFSRKSSVTNNK